MSVNHMNATLSTGPLPYWVIGEGRPLLYLHAAGGPQISPFLEELARSHRVLMPIAPGFEGTPFHPAVKTVRDLAGLYAEFAQAVIGTACDVMGHSFGGWTALWLAVSHSDCVDQLVLEAPAGLRFGAAAHRRAIRRNCGASFMRIQRKPRPSSKRRRSPPPMPRHSRATTAAFLLTRRCSRVCRRSRPEP